MWIRSRIGPLNSITCKALIVDATRVKMNVHRRAVPRSLLDVHDGGLDDRKKCAQLDERHEPLVGGV